MQGEKDKFFIINKVEIGLPGDDNSFKPWSFIFLLFIYFNFVSVCKRKNVIDKIKYWKKIESESDARDSDWSYYLMGMIIYFIYTTLFWCSH